MDQKEQSKDADTSNFHKLDWKESAEGKTRCLNIALNHLTVTRAARQIHG